MHPEYATPFWTNVKSVWGKCKLSLWRVCILWICEFNKNNFLLVTTKSNKENIYCDGKGSVYTCRLILYFQVIVGRHEMWRWQAYLYLRWHMNTRRSLKIWELLIAPRKQNVGWVRVQYVTFYKLFGNTIKLSHFPRIKYFIVE